MQIAVGGFLPALLLVTYSWLCPFIECERFEIGFLSCKRVEEWHTHANHVINIPRDKLHAMD